MRPSSLDKLTPELMRLNGGALENISFVVNDLELIAFSGHEQVNGVDLSRFGVSIAERGIQG